MTALGRMGSRPPSPEVAVPDLADVFALGTIEVHGRIRGSSNSTLLVTATFEDVTQLAVFKPESGERPLWDFPGGLWRREIAAYELSKAFSIPLIPETVLRDDPDFGPGAIAPYIEHDPDQHYFMLREDPDLATWFQTLAAFDVIANNSDRKGGHVLLGREGPRGIDHGLCFHVDDKLRTVIWDFECLPLTDEATQALETLQRDGLPEIFDLLLIDDEQEALRQRVDHLLAIGELPLLNEDGDWPPYPWPLI